MSTERPEAPPLPAGAFTSLDGEPYYRIAGYDRMPPFLMSIPSDTDLWMFLSSAGGLTAGRVDPDGSLRARSVEQKIAPGEPFAMPDGHVVKGVSALTDPDGRVIQQWVKTKIGERDPLAVAAALKGAFKGLRGRGEPVPQPGRPEPRVSAPAPEGWTDRVRPACRPGRCSPA